MLGGVPLKKLYSLVDVGGKEGRHERQSNRKGRKDRYRTRRGTKRELIEEKRLAGDLLNAGYPFADYPFQLQATKRNSVSRLLHAQRERRRGTAS